MLGIDIANGQHRAWRHGADALFDRHLGLALHGDGGRRGRRCLPRAGRRAASDRRAAAADRYRRGRGARRTGGRPARQRQPRARWPRTWYLRAARPAGRRRSGRARSDRRLQAASATPAPSAMPPRRLVAVDPEIGEVEMLDYVIVEDGGVLVNPMIVDGQSLRRRGARHRHGALRGDAVRRARDSRSPRRSRIICCPARPRCRRSASSTWRRRRRTRSSA